MASKVSSAAALLLLLNLLFFTMVSSTYVPCPPPKHSEPAPISNQPAPQPRCPKNTLELGACANLLEGLVHVGIGTPLKSSCCTLLSGLLDLEAAVCLCPAIKVKALELRIGLLVSLNKVLNHCGMKVPYGFQCPA